MQRRDVTYRILKNVKGGKCHPVGISEAVEDLASHLDHTLSYFLGQLLLKYVSFYNGRLLFTNCFQNVIEGGEGFFVSVKLLLF